MQAAPPSLRPTQGFVLAALLGLVLAASWQGRPSPAPVAAAARSSPPRLELRIRSGNVLLERQQWPVIQAELVNGGARERRLVLPGEGSAQGLRTPLLAWSLRGPGDSRPHAYQRPSTPSHKCGNLPPPRPEELVALAPGEARAFRPDISRLVLRTPGTYRVVLYYENDPAADWGAWRMLAGDEAAPWGEVAGSEAVRLASNELVFQVVE